jgi:hypothetical protein
VDEAAERWPEIASRRELLLRLVEEGRAAIAREDDDAIRARRDAIRRTSARSRRCSSTRRSHSPQARSPSRRCWSARRATAGSTPRRPLGPA